MAIEILTVSLSDESVERIAATVARMMSNQPVAQSNPPAPEPHRTQSEPVQPQQADPWATATPAAQYQQQQFQGGNGMAGQPAQGAPATQAPAGPVNPQYPQAPMCAHGAMRYVPAGFSQSTNKAYGAFYGCPQPRGAADKCRSVPA